MQTTTTVETMLTNLRHSGWNVKESGSISGTPRASKAIARHQGNSLAAHANTRTLALTLAQVAQETVA